MELRGKKGLENRDDKTSQDTKLGRTRFLSSSQSQHKTSQTRCGDKEWGKKWENNREKTQTGIEFGFEQHLEQNNPPKIWKIWEFREGHRRNAITPGAWEAAKAKPIRSKEILGTTDQGEIKEGVIKA